MSTTIKNLYYGMMATATTTVLYTNPSTAAGNASVIKSIIAVNRSASATTMNLMYCCASGSPTGTATYIIPKDLSLAGSYSMTFTPMVTLGPGDKIAGYASVSGAIDCTISGVELAP